MRKPIRPRGWDLVLQPHPVVLLVGDLDGVGPAPSQGLADGADVLLGDIDREVLDGLHLLAVDLLDDHLGAGDRELIALPPHGLDQHREVELATAADHELVGGVGLLDPQPKVDVELLEEAGAELARGAELPLTAGEGRVVDAEGHPHRGLLDGDSRQRVGVVGIGQGVADRHLVEPGQHHDVAGLGGFDRLHVEAAVEHDLGHLGPQHTLLAQHRDGVARAHLAAGDPADREAPGVVVPAEVGDQRLEAALLQHRRGDVVDDGLQQRLQAVGHALGPEARAPLAGDGVDHRDVQLVGILGQLQEEVVGGLERPLGVGQGAVQLVDHQDRSKPHLEGLAQHEPGLRHRPSAASIRSRQPSAMLSTRSTSPPKSACPGVSMMLIHTSP